MEEVGSSNLPEPILSRIPAPGRALTIQSVLDGVGERLLDTQ